MTLILVSVPRFLLSVFPPLLFLLIVGILWNARKDLSAVQPILLGILLITCARIIDVLIQYPSLAAILRLDLFAGHTMDVLNSIGDLSDAIGVFILITGFIQSVKYQINKKKQIDKLETLLPICATCKKVRMPDNTWEDVENYLRHVGSPPLTHGICPECKTDLLRERELKLAGHS
jgi:hypothetical protein